MTAHADLDIAVNAAQDEYDQLVVSSTATAEQLATAKAEILRLQAIIDSLVKPPPVDPPPVEVPSTLPKIPFKPPTLTNPTTIDLTGKTGGIVLDTTKDYILKLPKDKAWKNGSGLNISGGHNVVVIGGLVDVADGSNGVRRAGYFQKATGTVHVEGVKFFSSTQATLTEGINISAPDAVIQIANCDIATPCSGSYATNHADILQTWNGPKTLRVFGLKGKSNYQCMFLNAQDTNAAAQPIEGSWTLDRIDVQGGAYTLWLVPPPGSIKIGAQVHAYGGKGLWKPEMWPGVKTSAPTEDFVPNAGLAYTTPSYL